ncbi:MAG: hypothetical protein AVDCRST_MAG47-1790 [uncultured Nocardioidaceae bacterium]|uniref:Lysyl oxidase n=1 Tax=uncultured Nocardioidaceae bacterium TaxID=253824 RepID=A0A6J4N314_9ACTN|nr:MAG: hypothetical protein AVDCRST_MAG47-1790 [uncultured Nocardioidaceae bacterium]
MHQRALVAALSGATVALAGSVIGLGVTGSAQAADLVSPLRLTAPDKVVVTSFDGHVFSDLGIRMVAQGEKFEINATREPGVAGSGAWWDPSYDSPITATWKRASGDVDLGEMSSWRGLEDFASLQVFRTDGTRIRNREISGCFNGDGRRIGPNGPLSNPYPWGCPWNPFTLGSVMGIAQDYSAPLVGEFGAPMRLRPGTYELVASIAPDYRQTFGISDTDATVSTQLVVKEDKRHPSAAGPQRATDNLGPVGEEPTSSSAGALEDENAPDLQALPAFAVSLNSKGTAMRFAATVWNGGAGPLIIEGFRDDRTVDHMTAYQYYVDEHGDQTGFDQVGELHFHEGNHNHWHFEDFARYRLLAADPADPNLPGEAVVRSTKQSFCLVATDAVDLTVPNADMRPEYTDLGSQCGNPGSLSLREVLANGHGDTYYQHRTGQAFRLGDLEDGTYFIAVEANPEDTNGRNLRELDYTNNESYRKVELFTNAKGVRKVRAAPVGIIDEQEWR